MLSNAFFWFWRLMIYLYSWDFSHQQETGRNLHAINRKYYMDKVFSLWVSDFCLEQLAVTSIFLLLVLYAEMITTLGNWMSNLISIFIPRLFISSVITTLVSKYWYIVVGLVCHLSWSNNSYLSWRKYIWLCDAGWGMIPAQ